MSDAEYNYSINHHRRTGRYKAEITGPDGSTFVSPPFFSEGDATAWAARYIDAKTAGLVQSARPASPATPATHVATTTRPVQVHRTAQQVASIMGLPAPRATGGCYYCGMPLVNGVCEDCG